MGDVRNNPAQLREALEFGEELLTAGGKPFAIAIGADEESVEETFELLRRVPAMRAAARLHARAGQSGLRESSMDWIDGEVRNTREALFGSAEVGR